jgi:hypothetical protein
MTQKDYFLIESTRGTGASNTGTPTMYQFGLLPTDKKSILSLADDNELNEIEDITVHYVALTLGNNPLDDLGSKFGMVNGLALYWMLGKVTSAAGSSPPYVISYYTTNDKPSIAVFLEGDNSVKSYAQGCVAQALTINFESGMPALLAQLSFIGMGHGLSTAVPTATYPDNVITPFNQITHFKWNTTSYPIKAMNLNWNNKCTGLIGTDGKYQYIGTNSPIKHVITVMFKDGVDVTTIIADKRAGTSRALELKFAKSADPSNLYWTHAVNAICLGIQWVRVQGQPDQLVGVFWGNGTCTETIADGITTDSFYGL